MNDPQGMFAIDAAKMALGLGQIAGNEDTLDSRIAYPLYHTDGNLNFLKSIFDFYSKLYIQFCSELNSLFNGVLIGQ